MRDCFVVDQAFTVSLGNCDVKSRAVPHRAGA
jgi:hypothetical protein